MTKIKLPHREEKSFHSYDARWVFERAAREGWINCDEQWRDLILSILENLVSPKSSWEEDKASDDVLEIIKQIRGKK